MQGVLPTKLIRAGQAVFSEGDVPDGLYYICYGSVEISREEGGKQVLSTLQEGEVFGEMAIINSSARTATVTTKEDSGFYIINAHNFQSKVEELEPVMRGIFRVLVLQIRTLLERREQLEAQLAGRLTAKEQAEKEKERDIALARTPGQGLNRKLDF